MHGLDEGADVPALGFRAGEAMLGRPCVPVRENQKGLDLGRESFLIKVGSCTVKFTSRCKAAFAPSFPRFFCFKI